MLLHMASEGLGGIAESVVDGPAFSCTSAPTTTDTGNLFQSANHHIDADEDLQIMIENIVNLGASSAPSTCASRGEAR